jgi:hypothetical protein
MDLPRISRSRWLLYPHCILRTRQDANRSQKTTLDQIITELDVKSLT